MEHNELANYIEKCEILDYLELILAPYPKKLIDYGNGELLCEFEMHVLEYIINNPGTLICDVAQNWGYSICSASKTVKKLYEKGFISKQKENNNKKSIHLYATDKGLEQQKIHKLYDYKEHKNIIDSLLCKHSSEDLNAFFSVLESYTKYIYEHYDTLGLNK